MIKITRRSVPTDPVVRLRVDGRIVLRTAGELAKACHAALAEGPPVLVDVSGVVFVDPEGAAAIDALARRGVTVVGASPFIGALLRAHTDRVDVGDEADDAALVARLRNGAAAAVEELVRRHGPRALTIARSLLQHEDDARDVVREALLAACDRIRDLPPLRLSRAGSSAP